MVAESPGGTSQRSPPRKGWELVCAQSANPDRGGTKKTPTRLEQAQRIHIHEDGSLRNFFLFTECEQIRKRTSKLRALRSLQQKLEAIIALEPRQRRRSGAQHFHATCLLRS